MAAVVAEYELLEAELEERRAELETLERDERELPARAYKANLRDDPEAEQMLRSRYAAVCDRLPGCRSRIRHLEDETARYYDRIRAEWDGVEAAVEFQARSQLRPAAATAEARRELLRLRASILEALDAAITELSPDTADAVKLNRELSRQREQAKALRNRA